MEMIQKGFIRDFSGRIESTVGYFLMEDSVTGKVKKVACNSKYILQAFDAVYGGVVDAVGNVRKEAFLNKEIFWVYTEDGSQLCGFVPVEEAYEEIKANYEMQNALVGKLQAA